MIQTLTKMKLNYILSFAIILVCSCESMTEIGDDRNESPGTGRFITSAPVNLSLDIETRSSDLVTQYKEDDISLVIRKEKWTGKAIDTRNNVTGNEDFWSIENPTLALYITDTDGNLLSGNVPYSPKTGRIYYDWHSTNMPSEGYRSYTTREDLIQNVDAKSNFFWDTWSSKPSDMPANVNFYGYYPRASEGGTVSDNLHYYPTSIIDRTSANKKGEDWNILDFSFYATQTKNNLSEHDLMYSIPENASGTDHRAGNINKTKNDNIQVHFEHAFALFEITVTIGDLYPMAGIIERITLQGSQVYNNGKLNIGTLASGEERITPGQKGASILRAVSAEENTGETFKTTMIVPPCTVPKGDKEGMKIACNIDGGVYSCPIYSETEDLEFEGGTKYFINLTLAPDGMVIVNVWDGGSITIDGKTYDKEALLSLDFDKEYSFTTTARNGYKVYSVLEDGKTPANSIKRVKGVNKVYNVVVLPTDNWYATKNNYQDLRIHFDAKQHDKCYHPDNMAASVTPLIWSDLSGHGNDGTLQSFNNTSESGWQNNGVDGLAFDGIDDIVKYPGTINETAYTISFVIKIENNTHANRMHYRLNAEGNEYPAFFINTTQENKFGVHIYGHGVDTALGIKNNSGGIWTPVGLGIKQLDFTYSNKEVYVYVNGVRQYGIGDGKGYLSVPQDAASIDIASLGGRIEDYSRSLKGTYYSFMLYDRKLSDSEIEENCRINRSRFGF